LHTMPPPADASALQVRLTASGLVDQVVQQVRTLSLALRPPMMDDLGLVAALRWHVKGVTERTGLPVLLEADSITERLPAGVERACFRVVQEALTTVVKPARARQAQVELRRQGAELRLSVLDDGIGFDSIKARKRGIRGGTSLGLLSMEERVLLLGGTFGIESARGTGTAIRARIPLGSTAPTNTR